MSNKSIYLAWRSPVGTARWSPVGRLDKSANGPYSFLYTQGARSAGFSPLPGMEDLNKIYKSNKLFPIFYNRLLNSRREEYDSYLQWSGFEPSTPPDPLAILEVTEGRKTTDFFEVFPCPVANEQGMYEFRFFLHGVEWLSQQAVERANQLESDERLFCMYDIQNSYDANAIALRTLDDRQIVGYLPRYICHDFKSLADDCDPDIVSFSVIRVNPEAPLQFKVLCHLTACWPASYKPFSSDEFIPLAKNAAIGCIG